MWVRVRLCKLQKGYTRLTAASDKVYQLLAHGRWFSPGTPASSTTKTGRHDIAEILLKVALNHQKSIKNQILLENVLHYINDNLFLKSNVSLTFGNLVLIEREIEVMRFIFGSSKTNLM